MKWHRKLQLIAPNEASEVCGPCGGACCKAARLETALTSGNYAIDWWEGDPRSHRGKLSRGYFVRPSVAGHNPSQPDFIGVRVSHGSWGGACSLFVDGKGCSLAFDARPFQCRALVAGKCKSATDELVTKRKLAVAWLPYAEMLEAIGRRVESEFAGRVPRGLPRGSAATFRELSRERISETLRMFGFGGGA